MKTTIQKWFGTGVRRHRKVLGISQEELAFRAGLHRTYIGGIERGERNPTLSSIEKIARALGIKLQVLFKENK